VSDPTQPRPAIGRGFLLAPQTVARSGSDWSITMGARSLEDTKAVAAAEGWLD
jgi:hypothetical protein